MIKCEANPQNITADIGHDILLGQPVMESGCRFPAKSKKTRMLLITKRIEQFKICQRIIFQKLSLQSRDVVRNHNRGQPFAIQHILHGIKPVKSGRIERTA